MSKRKKYHSPEQIVRKLREADGMLAAGQLSSVGTGPANCQSADCAAIWSGNSSDTPHRSQVNRMNDCRVIRSPLPCG